MLEQNSLSKCKEICAMADIKLFDSKEIRSIWNADEGQWYFSIIDVVGALTDSVNPRDYFKKLRRRDVGLNSYLGTNCPQVTMMTSTGKSRRTLAGNVKQVLRIIQSIPSPKAEPFKLWLAQVGNERIEEIQNPELIMQRMRATYEAKGYSKEWIEKRSRGIAVRDTLTDVWKENGIKESRDFAILTAEISKATFGITPREHKEIKNLNVDKDNLRDHMTDLELLFTALGEASTTEIEKTRKCSRMKEHVIAAKDGGKIAGDARKELEKKTGKKVVSSLNYKELPEIEHRKLIGEIKD